MIDESGPRRTQMNGLHRAETDVVRADQLDFADIAVERANRAPQDWRICEQSEPVVRKRFAGYLCTTKDTGNTFISRPLCINAELPIAMQDRQTRCETIDAGLSNVGGNAKPRRMPSP